MTTLRLATSCLLALWLFGCLASRPLTEDEIIGTWVANHDNGADTLFVQPGGQYIHKFVFPTGTTYVDTGTWEYEEELEGLAGMPSHSLHQYRPYWNWAEWVSSPEDRERQKKEGGIWAIFAMVNMHTGECRIPLHTEFPYYFQKTKNVHIEKVAE